MNKFGPEHTAAVIVSWRSAEDTLALLEVLSPAFAAGLRAVIVENGSGDDTFERIEAGLAARAELRTGVTLLRNEENLGFTGGVNTGVDAALSLDPAVEWIWLLNPDARAGLETLEELLLVAQESGREIITSNGKWLLPNAWPKPFFARPDDHWRNAPGPGRWWPVGAYGGACVLFNARLVRDLIASSGRFQSPELFMYWDEWDTTLRAKALGGSVVMAGKAVVEHDSSIRTLGETDSARFRQYYMARNGVMVSRRNMPAWQFWLTFPVRLGRDFSWFARVAMRGQRPHPGCYLIGTWDGLRSRGGRWSQHA